MTRIALDKWDKLIDRERRELGGCTYIIARVKFKKCCNTHKVVNDKKLTIKHFRMS